jgi:hypothetical protein
MFGHVWTGGSDPGSRKQVFLSGESFLPVTASTFRRQSGSRQIRWDRETEFLASAIVGGTRMAGNDVLWFKQKFDLKEQMVNKRIVIADVSNCT